MHKFSKASLIPLCHIFSLLQKEKGILKDFSFRMSPSSWLIMAAQHIRGEIQFRIALRFSFEFHFGQKSRVTFKFDEKRKKILISLFYFEVLPRQVTLDPISAKRHEQSTYGSSLQGKTTPKILILLQYFISDFNYLCKITVLLQSSYYFEQFNYLIFMFYYKNCSLSKIIFPLYMQNLF